MEYSGLGNRKAKKKFESLPQCRDQIATVYLFACLSAISCVVAEAMPDTGMRKRVTEGAQNLFIFLFDLIIGNRLLQMRLAAGTEAAPNTNPSP